ncbi:DUF1275 family protein, partial [Kitasatospora sp. NPDC059463]|uniref:DUF1275 family protein n=1 Tax=Kitasatospora sp. NPDC059463 TaxID=3346842 RepID=UPI0036799995
APARAPAGGARRPPPPTAAPPRAGRAGPPRPPLDGGAARYPLIVLLGLGMGLQNAVARRLGVPDLTTTVLTLTLTGLAADSPAAGGTGPRPGRRILSALAMLLGGLAGAVLVLHGRPAPALALATLLLLVTALAARRLSAPDAPWAPPTA